MVIEQMSKKRSLEIDVVLSVLALHDNDVSAAAKTLKRTRNTIYSLLSLHGYEVVKTVRKVKR
jgi:DNA-binding NtrC family response regulator